ncbi:hypothetical protein [Sedimentitalea sp.]|uniref:hypothetical protein n=1 Tax=Sedimentitalea sp. TaxID=2048915 RepID=UPI0032983092
MKYILTAFFICLALASFPVISTDVQKGAAELANLGVASRDLPYVGMLLGALIIFILYSLKFRDWPDENLKPPGFPARPTRDFTTWLNYQLWASVYILSGILIAVALFATPHQIVAVACGVMGDTMDRLCKEGAAIGAQYSLEALALGVSTAVAFLGLPKIEPAWRQQLQKLAMIPSRAVSLANSLQSEFRQFAPHPEEVSAFLEDYNTQAGRPSLYEADFSEVLKDENYLETYPRIEFIIDRLDRLNVTARGDQLLNDYADDIDAVKGRINDVRSRILGIHQAIKGTLGLRYPGEIAELHAEAGYELPPNGFFSVTLLDNVVKKASDWTDEQSTPDKELTQFFSEALRDIRQSCDKVNQRLVQIVVLMSLRGVDQPFHVLRDLGFSKRIQKETRIGIDMMPAFVGFILLASFAITIFLELIFDQQAGRSIFVFATGMPIGSLLGSSIVAGATALGDGRDVKNVQLSEVLWDLTLCAVAGAAAAIFVISFLPSVFNLEGAGGQDFHMAAYYTPVTGFLGAYFALCNYRTVSQPDRPGYRKPDFFFVPLGVVTLIFMAGVLTHLDEINMFLQWSQFKYTLGYSAAGVLLTFAMMLPLVLQHRLSESISRQIET